MTASAAYKHNRFAFLDATMLKILALLFMLSDHLWASVIPGNDWMTWLGRLAFPIFAYQIAEGFVHTSNVKRYAKRLLIAALISEIPFNLFYISSPIFPFHQNVMFTLLLGLLAIWAIDNARSTGTAKGWAKGLALVAGCLLLAVVGFVDYGYRGVLTVIVFYLFRDHRFAWAGQLAAMVCLNIIFFTGLVYPVEIFGIAMELPMQSFAVFALIPIWLYNGKKGNYGKWLQYGTYAFYPVHMLFLYALTTLL